MGNNEVRALCALITLETDPKKCDALIAELTKAITRTRLPLTPQTAKEQRWPQSTSQGTRKVG
jgi:hypothetical protein